MTLVSAISSKPVPVILACDPLPALWPHSTRQSPFVFRPDAEGMAPAVRLALAFAARDEFAEAILVAPQSASAQVMHTLGGSVPNLRLVFVPDHVKPVTAALLAAMMTVELYEDAPLVLVPSNIVARDLEALVDTALKMVQLLLKTDQAITLSRLLRDTSAVPEGDMLLQINGRNEATGLQAGRVLPGKNDLGDVEALLEMKCLAKGLGLFAISAGLLLKTANSHFPNASDACRFALEAAPSNGQTARRLGNFLKLSTSVPLHQLVDRSGASILLFPADEGVKLVQSLADLPDIALPRVLISPEQCGSRIIVDGFADYRLFSTADGTFIVQPGQENLAALHFDDQLAKPDALALAQYQRWGNSQTICQREHLQVIMHTIGIRSSKPSTLHETQVSCLSVVSGQGTAIVEGVAKPVVPGDQILVSAGAFYALACTGKEPLIVAETLTSPGKITLFDAQPARLTA